MVLDLAVLAALLLAALAGACSGALRQLVQLAAAVIGWAAARFLGPSVAIGFARFVPGPMARPVAAGLLFAGGFALASLLGAALVRASAKEGGGRGPADRGLGALLGGAKAALVLWVIVSVLALLGGVAKGEPARQLRQSDLVAFAREHNLLRHAEADAVRSLRRVLDQLDPAAVQASPELRALMEDPNVRAVLERTRAGEPGALEDALADPALRATLERMRARVTGDYAEKVGQ